MTNADTLEEVQITDETRWNILYTKTQALSVLKAFTLLRKHGIEPILIKGLAAAQYYPKSKLRGSVDTDMAVSADDFERASEICVSEEANGLAIDLHRELRHLDTVGWDDLFANSRLLDVEGGTIRVLRPEDHLRVLIVHWLTDSGSQKEELWDIYYMIENRPPDFDWDRFLNSVSKRRRRWLVCTIGLAHKYLGLDVSTTPIKDEANKLPSWLVKSVEREWDSETKHFPLEYSFDDRKLLVRQILKRFRPNPIWATVSMEGSFDAKTRVFYQIGNFFYRIPSSYRRVSEMLRLRSK